MTSGPTRTAPPGTRAHSREHVVGASGLSLIAGIWLLISPWILGYGAFDTWWNPIASGAVVSAVSLAQISGAFRLRWLGWVNAATGIWLFASAFWLAEDGAGAWNVGIAGVVVFFLAIMSVDASLRR